MLEHAGRTRTTTSTVHFRNAFRIGRDARELPAGSYTIHVLEEVHEGTFDPVYVTTSIDLVVETRGGSTSRIVTPADLRTALERDAIGLDDASEHPDRGRSNRVAADFH